MSPANDRAKFALLSTFIVLTAVTTLLVRIPIPATTGYFNLGDIFIVASGLLFGPIAGLLTGILGAGTADAVGYLPFVPATVVTKGLEGFLVGILSKGVSLQPMRAWIAALVGGATIVLGYFLFEAYIYPALGKSIPFFNITNFQAAIVELGPNAVQGFIGAAGGIGLWRALASLRTAR